MAAEVRMTVEEYLDLIEKIAQGGKQVVKGARRVSKAAKKVRRGKAPSGMSRALKRANSRAKKKDGSFRKGWNRSKMMKYAHKIRRKGA